MAKDKDIEISGRVHGFKPGARQFHRRLRIQLPRIASFDETAAMTCLDEVFGMAPEAIAPPENLSGKTPTAAEMAYLTTALSLAKSLLRSSGLPSFERERILAFPAKDATKHRSVTLEVPVVERMPASLYLDAYKAAMLLMIDFGKPVSQRKDFKKRADALKADLIDPAKRKSNGRPLDIYILKEAFERGIQITHCGNAVYRLGLGSKSIVFARSSTERDAAIGFQVARVKTETLNWLRQGGVPVPRSIPVSNRAQALKAAQEIGFPVVIKPADRDRSEGVTLDIDTPEAVHAAVDQARKYSGNLLVEARIPGLCHRIVTYRNRFVFAFTRHPKSVVGDGAQSIEALVAAGNRKRERQAEHVREKPYPLDDEALACLGAQGLTPAAIPDVDQVVHLRRNNTPEDGGYGEIVTDSVHPDNIALAERVSRIMRLDSMGLDLISTDVTAPWHATGACVTEVNAVPQIGPNSARAYIDMSFGDTTGAIPIHFFVGDAAAMEAAASFRDTLEQDGAHAVLTSATQSIGPGGRSVALADAPGLFARAAILQNDPAVDVLVLVVQDDELLQRGRPFQEVAHVEVVNTALRSFPDSEQLLSPERVEVLLGTFEVSEGQKDLSKAQKS